MKANLPQLLTSLFLIIQTSVVFSQYNNPIAPSVGTTSKFLLFTSLGAVTNAGSTSIYAGNVGTNSGAFTGFESLQTQPFALFNATPETAQCATDLGALYTDLNSRLADIETTGGYGSTITTLTQGIYNTGGAISVNGTLTLDGQNNPNSRFIIRSGGAFTMGAGSKIILINGTQAQNVFWIITGAVSLAANSEAKGIFISSAAISLGANCTLEGGVLTTAGTITTLDGMSLATPSMLLKENQSINSGATPADLVLIRNNNPILKWQSATDSNFTSPTDINHYLGTLGGFCIGPLTSTTYYRVAVLIDGSTVYSNTVKIDIVVPPTMEGPASSFALFTTAGAIANTGISTNMANIGTNAGVITGQFTNMSLLHVQDALTTACANFILPLFNSLKNIPTTSTHPAALGAGETLQPGVYKIASAATLGGILTLDGQGLSNSVFIFKITGALAMAAHSQIIVTNGAITSNIFWVIDGALEVGASSDVKGNFICLAGAIALGNNTIAEGRFLTIAGAITLENATLSIPIIPIASSNQVICSGAQPNALTLTGNVTTVVQWQKSTDLVFSNPTDIPNTTASLTGAEMGNVSATTYFRAVVTIGSKTLNSTIVTIAINQATIPGIISSNQEFCSASQPADLILEGNCGSVVKWQSALDSDFTTPIDIENTTNTLSGIAIGTVTVTTFYRAVVQNCTCCPIGYATPAEISIATPTTWNGTSWNNGPPNSTRSAIFSGNYTASENIDACSITINNGAVVTINTGATMTATNELNISGGSLTFENNASLIQINDGIINSGNVTYKRQSTPVRNSDYTYWSSPVAGQILSAAFPNSPLNTIYSFDAFSTPEDYIRVTPSSSMGIGKGYIVQGPQTNSSFPASTYETNFFGIPNNGIIETPIGPRDSSNLIGNPYPSAIDADQFLALNSALLDGTIYFWTHSTAIQLASQISNPGSGAYAYTSDDYASYNLLGGVAVFAGGIPTGKIAAGQSFFAISDAPGNAIFNNNMRTDSNNNVLDNTQFFKMTQDKTKVIKTLEKSRVWLNFTNVQGIFKQALVGYVTGATNLFDDNFDGESFDGHEFVDFYSINSNKNLSIQGRTLPFDKNDEVILGFRTTVAGTFKISIDHVDGFLQSQEVFIKDKVLQTIFNLKNGDYTFTTTEGVFNDRFVLLYSNKSLGTNDITTTQSSVLVSHKSKQININSAVEPIDKVYIYDLAGRQIYQKDNINTNTFSILELDLSHQPLFVKTILQSDKVVTTKILF